MLTKCPFCQNRILSGTWLGSLPKLSDSAGNEVSYLRELNSPIIAYVCARCNWFSLVNPNSFTSVPQKRCLNEQHCWGCDKKMEVGYWGSFFPVFKKNNGEGFLVVNLLGNHQKMAVMFCPKCSTFLNLNAEFEEVSAADISGIQSQFTSKMAKEETYKWHITRGTTVAGTVFGVSSFVYFWLQPTERIFSQKILIVSIIGAVVMSLV